MEKVCTRCLTSKPLEEFSKRASAKDGLQPRCRICQRELVNQHYSDNKQYYKDKARVRNTATIIENRRYVISYLRDNPCIDCGNSDIEVLQFDHRDRDTKSGEVSSFLDSSLERVKLEISKCDIRCANCHIKRSRRQLGWWTEETLVV